MARRKQTLPPVPNDLRIIGGKFRGRKLVYEMHTSSNSPVTRPMKHRVRESLFNLVSTECKGLHAIDLFAGTGALGLEALSRGAASALFIERHVPTSRVIQQNITALEVEAITTLKVTSAFLWAKRDLEKSESEIPWLVFCSPPFAFYVERRDEMLALIDAIMQHAPKESIVLVEADTRFDFDLLPDVWDVRTYMPAVIGVWRKK